MDGYSKLSKKDIKILTKYIRPYIFIGEEFYKEEFKQVYHITQGANKKDGLYVPYIISSFGRLFTIKSDNTLKERKVPIDKNGYNLVVINIQGKPTGVRIHRLVANAFIKNNNKKRNEVNHIDGIKTHNYIWNLEWTTSSENKQHAIKNNLAHFAKGENAGKAKYTNKQIEKVCKMLEENILTKTEIANLTDVSQHMVNDIYKHRYWTHISIKYDFTKRNKSDQEYIDKIHLTCKMIEANKSYKEIEIATGFDFKVVSEIYRKKKFKKISDNYNFTNYNYGK